MSINEEYELKTILYENLELFDLIDKYVGRQEEKKKGWFWGGEGEDKEQLIEDNYGKILLLILKRRIEEEIKSEFGHYKYTTTEDNIIKYIKDYNQAYFSNTKETTQLLPPKLNPDFNFSNNLYIGVTDNSYTQINTVKDILIKIVDHSPLHDGIKVKRSIYNSAIHYKNIPIQGIKIEDTNLTTLDKATNFVLSKREEIQILLAELRDQLLLTYRKYVNGNYNDKKYLDILFENITQKHCKAKNAWCFFEYEMVTNGWNYIVKYKRPPPTSSWTNFLGSKKIRVLALHPDDIQYNYNPSNKPYDPYGNDNSPSQDKLYLLIILAANTLNYMIHTKFKQAPCEFYKSRLAMKTNKLFYFDYFKSEPSSDALHTKSKGSITSFFNATGNIQKRLISFIIQKTKEGIETPTKLGMFIKKIFSKIIFSQQNSNTVEQDIPVQYNHLNYFILLRITKFCNSYKKFMFGPASETSAFAPWQDTDIQAQKTWQEKKEQNTFEKMLLSKANVKYKSIDFENMKGNTLETGLDSNKTITAYNMCNKNGKLSDIIQKKTTNITKGKTTLNIQEYIPKNADISGVNCVEMLISEEDEKKIYKNLFNKFITGKNIKFGIVKSDYQKDFNLLILKSKQYFKNDNSWIDNEPNENEKKEYNMKTQLLITIGYLYFIKSTYENCMFGISKYFKKGDKSASAANYAITAVYYILLFLIGTGTAGTGLLVVGYIYMTVDMVKTELLFRNIKYASMTIIDNSQEVAKKFSDSDKKMLGSNIISDNDLNPTVGGTKKKRKNKTKRKNKYNRKTRK